MFYRRLWLALLVAVFAVVAPAVVFYTAGYRWNAKKGVIERNGTLIVDTEPTGARIFLNGQLAASRSPSTRQDIAPGTYHIRLEREGYWPWEKTLEVRPERVTFITDVWLWRKADPTLVHEAEIFGIAASPDGDRLAFTERVQDDIQLVIQTIPDEGFFGVATASGGEEHMIAFPPGDVPTGTTQLVWSSNSNGVLIQDERRRTWVARVGAQTADRLPEGGVYRWEGGDLVGVRLNERFVYRLTDGSIQQSAFEEGVIDEQGRYQIIEDASGLRTIIERGDISRQFALPGGAWVFAGSEGRWMFLRNNRATSRWLAFRPDAAENEVRSVNLPVTAPPTQTTLGDDTLFVTYGSGEMWVVALGGSAELLTRTSQPITGAVWHTEGPYLFYATQRDVSAVGLDTRDGREQVTLASFTRITQLTAANDNLYIAGTRGTQAGIWLIPTE